MNLRPTAPEINTLPLDQLAGKMGQIALLEYYPNYNFHHTNYNPKNLYLTNCNLIIRKFNFTRNSFGKFISVPVIDEIPKKCIKAECTGILNEVGKN